MGRTSIVALALLAACSRSAPSPSPLEPQQPTPVAPTTQPETPPAPVAIAPQPPAPTPAEDGNADLTPSKAPRRFQILNGRLSAILPTGSSAQEIEQEVPLPTPGVPTSQTRHAIEQGETFLVVASFELYSLAGTDFEGEVRAGLARWKHPPRNYRVEPVPAKAPLRVLQVTLASPDRAGLGDLSMVTLLYVAHPDGTAQCLEVHANDEALAQAAQVVATARAIGESLEPGPLGLPRAAGPRTIQVGPGTRFLVDLPEGYVATVDNGYHYPSLEIRKLAPIATSAPTIVVTWDDSVPAPTGPAVRGELFGQPVTFHRSSHGRRRFLDALVETDESRTFVTLGASTAAELDALRPIAATLREEPVATP